MLYFILKNSLEKLFRGKIYWSHLIEAEWSECSKINLIRQYLHKYWRLVFLAMDVHSFCITIFYVGQFILKFQAYQSHDFNSFFSENRLCLFALQHLGILHTSNSFIEIEIGCKIFKRKSYFKRNNTISV